MELKFNIQDYPDYHYVSEKEFKLLASDSRFIPKYVYGTQVLFDSQYQLNPVVMNPGFMHSKDPVFNKVEPDDPETIEGKRFKELLDRKLQTVHYPHKEYDPDMDNKPGRKIVETARETITGENSFGEHAGKVLDGVSVFLPRWVGVVRNQLKSIINPKPKPEVMPQRLKPFLSQKSTWEGIAALAGAIGLAIYPEAAVQIVMGVFGVIGGIEAWKRESEDE